MTERRYKQPPATMASRPLPPLSERLWNQLPHYDTTWTTVDYLIQEAAVVMEAVEQVQHPVVPPISKDKAESFTTSREFYELFEDMIRGGNNLFAFDVIIDTQGYFCLTFRTLFRPGLHITEYKFEVQRTAKENTQGPNPLEQSLLYLHGPNPPPPIEWLSEQCERLVKTYRELSQAQADA